MFSYNQLWMILLIATIITPPLDIYGVKLNYILSSFMSFTIIICVIINKIRLLPSELIYFIFFITYFELALVYGSDNLIMAMLYGIHLIGIFLIPVLIRRDPNAFIFISNIIMIYTVFNCMCVIVFYFYTPSGLPIWVTRNGYAFLYQPYLFAIFVGFSLVFALYRNTVVDKVLVLLFLYFLLHSNSRIITVLFLALIIIISSNKTKLILLPSIILLMIVVPPLKLLTVIGSADSPAQVFNTDGSILMRLDAFYNFIDWLNLSRLLHGAGYRAFEEFSFPYGVPGPTDVLYLRMISEVGIIGMISVLLGFIYFSSRNYIKISQLVIVSGVVLCIGVAQESWYAASAGHVLSLLYAGLGILEIETRRSSGNRI